MYARLIKGHIKPEKFDLASQMLEKDVIPVLKKQKGFRDELSFFNRELKEGWAISFWDNKEDMIRYEREVYPELRDKMAKNFEDLPVVQNFEVANSTWYHIHAA
jgi:hypothetical protein